MSNARFSIAPAAAVSDKEMPDSVFRTLACLGVFGDKNGWCWPALETIAKMRGVSKPRISQDIKILVKMGYVQKEAQFRNNEQQTNRYRILFDRNDPDGLTPEVNPPLTPEVNPPLTTGVNQNALVNAPINAPAADNKNIYKLYEQNIGHTTPMIADRLDDMLKEYGEVFVIDSIAEAVSHNAKNLKYMEACCRNWKARGRGNKSKSDEPITITPTNTGGFYG